MVRFFNKMGKKKGKIKGYNLNLKLFLAPLINCRNIACKYLKKILTIMSNQTYFIILNMGEKYY